MNNNSLILNTLCQLTATHYTKSFDYKWFVDTFFQGKCSVTSIVDLPYLPVRALKEFDLKSIPDDNVYKIMKSSGTTGQFSKIYLDRDTANAQSKALIEITKNTLGRSRLPMLIIDSERTIRDRLMFSARTAAINGFSIFARERFFSLDNDFILDFKKTKEFINKNKNQTILIFGFTSFIWEKLLIELENKGEILDLSNSILLHGGGWKKLSHLGVSNDKFKKAIKQYTGCGSVHNYYGMVEQTGSIFMECKYGKMHASRYSEILVRDQNTLAVVADGEVGLLQVISTLPKSYPGHSLLTEDVGRVWHNPVCQCGDKGTVVEVLGRVAAAEVRGCSDAYN